MRGKFHNASPSPYPSPFEGEGSKSAEGKSLPASHSIPNLGLKKPAQGLGKLLVIFALLIAIAPAAIAQQLLINGHEVTLGQRLVASEGGPLAPLVELAAYLGAEVAQDDHKLLLRWGNGAEAQLPSDSLKEEDGIAYIPLTELADLLGAKLLRFTDSIYIFSPRSELESLSYSYVDGLVRLRFSRLAPLEVERTGQGVELRFHNSVLRIAPRTGRFPGGPLERLELYQEEPNRVILKLGLRGATDYRMNKSFADGEYLVELRFEPSQNGSQIPRFAGSRPAGSIRLTPWISYYHEDRRTVAGQVVIDYLLVKYYQDHYRLQAALPGEGPGTLEELAEMVRELGGAAGINANFFDPHTNMPIGLVIKDGRVLSPPYGRRAALGIDLFGRPILFNQDSLPFLPLRDAVGAGPLLLQDGQLALDQRGEGFTPNFVEKRAARSALGITSAGDLIMLVVRKDGRSMGVNMEELAELLRELGAADALALDGGSSASLVFRQGLNLHSIGNRRIAVGLVLVPK